MPIYEYTCDRCESEFEALVRSSTVPECPRCHSTELTKMLSVFATAAASAEPMPTAATSPCGACGDLRGPGSCAFE